MARIQENFDINIAMAAEAPELLEQLLVEEIALVGRKKALESYHDPASPEQIERLGRGLTWLWLDINNEPDLTDLRPKPVRAHTSRNDFIVTPTAMTGFRPIEHVVELESSNIFQRPRFLFTRTAFSVSLLPEAEPPIAEYKMTRQRQEFKSRWISKSNVPTEPIRQETARLPASNGDINMAMNVIKWADPVRYPENYKLVAS